MNAEQFIEKYGDYPDAMRHNKNCLIDMACPDCGERERFLIQVTTVMEHFDNGSGEHQDIVWGLKSFCACGECGRERTVADFIIPGLDEAIAERKDAR